MRKEKGPGKVLAEDEKGINMQRAEGGRTVSNNVEKRMEVKKTRYVKYPKARERSIKQVQIFRN